MKNLDTKNFIVFSLNKVGTFESDRDLGVVRVSGWFLKQNTKRNSLLKITRINKDGTKGETIVRLARAATGGIEQKKALRANEIALQYDDLVMLGIKKAGTSHELEIKAVNEWQYLHEFLTGHTSPLIRLQTFLAIYLVLLGGVVGLIVGLLIPLFGAIFG